MRVLIFFAVFLLISFMAFKAEENPSNDHPPKQQIAHENGKVILPPEPIKKKTLNKSAVAELAKNEWVKDLYVSADILNVGVIATEKQWESPAIGKYVCAVLKNNNISLRIVRFVDIEKVAYQKKTPRDSEIYSFDCAI